MDAKEAIRILERFRKGESTAVELQLVEQWYQQLEATSDWEWKEGEKEAIGQLMEERLMRSLTHVGRDDQDNDGGAKLRQLIKRIAVAASIVLVVGLGSYFLFFNKGSKPPAIVKTKTPGDVKAPSTNRAMITLANGDIVYLDSAANGTLATTGNVTVTKNSTGEIVYAGSAAVMEYNTLFNPRGSKVQPLTLSDGTKVWLNSESSIKYPTAFSNNERKVEITGEAYFEVTHDANRKFIVAANGVNTEVLGTHFNVNSYTDEGNLKITLLEGSVKVTRSLADARDDKGVVIKPGQQASVSDKVNVIDGVNLEEVMAWKNGKFFFADATIDAVMNQVARWYDVQFEYEGNKPAVHFVGDISRLENVSEVLKMLEQTKAVRFSIDGKKITVKKN